MAGMASARLERLSPARTARVWSAALVACFTFAICYFRSFVVPDVPILFWGDQLGFATSGSRLLAGQLPYRDYFQFLTPGTDVIYALLFRWFGVSLWVPNAVMALLGALTALWMTLCSARLLRGVAVLLPGLLLTGFVLYGSLDATHHWFSTVVIMAALLILLDSASYARVVAVGVLCGVAASFTQTKGAAAVLGSAAYLAWKSRGEPERSGPYWRLCLLLCGAALATFAMINVPFILAAGVSRWVDCVLVFPARYYSSVPINNWLGTWTDFQIRGGFLKWVCYPFMYATVPLVYIVFFWVMRTRRRDEPDEPWGKLLAVACTGVAMFLAVVPALSIKRISSVSPPAMILLVWLLSRQRRAGTLAATLGAMTVAIAIAMPLRVQERHWSYLDLPAGRAAIEDPAVYEVYRWTMAHTRPGQMYFGMPPMYLPLKLRNPAPIDAPGPSEYTRPEQIAAVIEALETNRVPLLLLRRSMYTPHALGYSADHLRSFQDYLYRHYRLTKTFSTGDEVWELD